MPTLMTHAASQALVFDDVAIRALDLAASALGGAIFAPVVTVAACLTALGGGGSPFFVQERVGRGRRPFNVIKIRTFDRGAVTAIGRWLRPTGIDEFPQFINVLRGEMSMVGPRPLTPGDAGRLVAAEPAYATRFEEKPGITGLAQVYGTRSVRHTMHLERLYARRRTVGSDVVLVALSLAINVAGRTRVRAAIRNVRRWRNRRRRKR